METEFDDEPPFIHQRNARQGAQVIQVESTKALPLIVTLCVLVGLALGVSFWALSYADKARMESRILQVKVEGFENAMHAHGLNPNPHLPGER